MGTQALTPLRLLGGAIGFGLRRNVKQLYAFLLQHFEPDDRIFLFGFSRGAFTVRVVANLLFYCGIAEATDKRPTAIDALAKEAVDAYAARAFNDPMSGPPADFRRRRGLHHPTNVGGEKGWFPVHFVGVWDTVEAYGLPIDEMANALWFLMPLRLKERGRLRENDLHPLIANAYHALAIDDERHSFHPKLWIESVPWDPGTAQPIPNGDSVIAFPKVPRTVQQAVQQVWFPGMHANVGGGYPQDQLAHVSLTWMIEEAKGAGLRVDPALERQYAQAAEPLGKMYDSRGGLGAYYRYRPRDLTVLCAEGGILEPTLHASVFQRIKQNAQDYAPTGIPGIYTIEPLAGSPHRETTPGARIAAQRAVDDLIWRGRVEYFCFLAWSAALIVVGRLLAGTPVPDVETYSQPVRGAYFALKPIFNLTSWAAPSYVEPYVHAFSFHPVAGLAFAISLGVILVRRRARLQSIRDQSNAAWDAGYGLAPPVATQPGRLSVDALRHLGRANTFAEGFHRVALPYLSIMLMLAAVVVVLGRWVSPIVSLRPGETRDLLGGETEAPFDADLGRSLSATPVVLAEGAVYRVSATHGCRGEAAATARSSSELHVLFQASIGPDDAEGYDVDGVRVVVPRTSGRLYLRSAGDPTCVRVTVTAIGR